MGHEGGAGGGGPAGEVTVPGGFREGDAAAIEPVTEAMASSPFSGPGFVDTFRLKEVAHDEGREGNV